MIHLPRDNTTRDSLDVPPGMTGTCVKQNNKGFTNGMFHHRTNHTQCHWDFILVNVSIIFGFIIIITSYFIAVPFRVLPSVVAVSFGLLFVSIIHVIKIIMIVGLNHFLFV